MWNPQPTNYQTINNVYYSKSETHSKLSQRSTMELRAKIADIMINTNITTLGAIH